MTAALDRRILDAIEDFRGGQLPGSGAVADTPVPALPIVNAVAAVASAPIIAATTAADTLTPPPFAINDELTTLLDRSPVELDRLGESPILLARCDDVARRIVRDGGQVNISSLSREIGSCPATVKRLLASPTFRKVYGQVSDELLGTIDERITNERLDLISRRDSLQRRAMTVLAEAMEIARAHNAAVRNGATARPGLIKVGIEAATEVRQIGSAMDGVAGNGSPTTVNINVTRNQAMVIQGAIRESGVDLSDVIGDLFTQAPLPALTKETL